ncbi:hypothetical protein ASAC_1376 [Acidilobus saccharovorans 345-15]|uniref:Uncharacterized protein n=1 Tax=Acidilobus saccharovorans (strain DSM 16705 / JCM 18335 / VKM B-2471 / 345-15) TaxID=666510 RepID=D9PYZ4_ACIS3|nr:hypothetical protein [Acidilobus saccharovorans]ADL19781.1 hypothetical protein ASAC_1376 [Acidilobus saccharovorans 345-15]
MKAVGALAAILVIVVATSLLTGLYLIPKLLRHGEEIIIKAYAVANDSEPVQLTNASFSVWAWAPTPDGTQFIAVYNGTGPQANISAGRLTGWAEDWVHRYGRAVVYSLEPSIIIWVSYAVDLPNGSVEVIAQPIYQPLNLSLALSGRGAVISVIVGHPFRTILETSGNGIKVTENMGGTTPAQSATTTTVSTTITTEPASPPYYLVPHVLAWYPNDTGMAPISLALAAAQPSTVSGSGSANAVIEILDASELVDQFSVNSITLLGSEFESALGDAESGKLFQAVSELSPLMGAAFTFTTGGKVVEGNGTEADTPTLTLNLGQLYIVGQGALVNWTEEAGSSVVAWYLGLQLTEVQVVEDNGAEAPAVYVWQAYDRCVNLSMWAYEQELLMQSPGRFLGTGMNSTCPLPNTPAPVIWQDYATNLAYYATVSPGSTLTKAFVDLSVGVNGASSPLGVGLDLGSAIASASKTISMIFGRAEAAAAADLIAGVLNPFQYQSYSVAVSANTILIGNGLPKGYYASAYYSNLTPVYYNASGYGFTLPRELVFINLTSSP